MGYTKRIESKITRTRHLIEFSLNTTARQLKSYLANVPDDAVVTTVVGDDESNSPEIEFEVEVVNG